MEIYAPQRNNRNNNKFRKSKNFTKQIKENNS